MSFIEELKKKAFCLRYLDDEEVGQTGDFECYKGTIEKTIYDFSLCRNTKNRKLAVSIGDVEAQFQEALKPLVELFKNRPDWMKTSDPLKFIQDTNDWFVEAEKVLSVLGSETKESKK
jgi:hypothetical protein